MAKVNEIGAQTQAEVVLSANNKRQAPSLVNSHRGHEPQGTSCCWPTSCWSFRNGLGLNGTSLGRKYCLGNGLFRTVPPLVGNMVSETSTASTSSRIDNRLGFRLGQQEQPQHWFHLRFDPKSRPNTYKFICNSRYIAFCFHEKMIWKMYF